MPMFIEEVIQMTERKMLEAAAAHPENPALKKLRQSTSDIATAQPRKGNRRKKRSPNQEQTGNLLTPAESHNNVVLNVDNSSKDDRIGTVGSPRSRRPRSKPSSQ
jgi:predicted double-glycine peptidase